MPQSTYQDHYWGTPRRIAQRPREYPFRMNGDVATYVYESTYAVDIGRFTPTAAGTVDPENAAAYLLEETKPEIEQGRIATFRRTYSTVPTTQITYSSREVTKPLPSAVGITGQPSIDYVALEYPGVDVGLAFPYLGGTWVANKVYSRLPTTHVRTGPTGGTFTLTYRGSTTAALAHNAANATINTAINGLATVITDGLTFSASNNLLAAAPATPQVALTITAGSTSFRVTMNAGSLTPAGASTAFTSIQSPTLQVCSVALRAIVTAHGFNAANPLSVIISTNSNHALLAPSTMWSVVDANTIAFFVNPSAGISLGQYLRDYTPGIQRVRTKNTQNFYLPGVTPGIATPGDIPIPTILQNDISFLTTALSTLSGYQAYSAGELDKWRSGAIYTQATVEIDMATL
jgi:hypothetical protein